MAVSPAPAPPAFYEALDDVADELRASIQNLHVDVLRQFQIQKSEVAALLEAHESRIAELLRENAGLRRENEELRLPWVWGNDPAKSRPATRAAGRGDFAVSRQRKVHRERVRAAEHAPRGPFRFLERRHRLATSPSVASLLVERQTTSSA